MTYAARNSPFGRMAGALRAPLLRRLVRPNRDGRAKVKARQIYILPTGFGVLFALLLMLMLIGSINYANNLGFLLTFLLVGLGLVAMLHSWRNLLGLELQAGQVSPVFAGETVCFPVHLHNHGKWGRPGLQLGINRSDPVATDVPGKGTEVLMLETASLQRGVFPIPRFTLSTRYPLGLYRAWTYVQLGSQCLVYPQPSEHQPENSPTAYRQSQIGDRGVGADDFTGLRHYRPGDSPRHINWKALAREQGLQTKLFGGDRAERRWLDWDDLSGETEHRLSQLCRGVLDAAGEEIEFGLRLPGKVIKPGRGAQQRDRCLAALARHGEST